MNAHVKFDSAARSAASIIDDLEEKLDLVDGLAKAAFMIAETHIADSGPIHELGAVLSAIEDAVAEAKALRLEAWRALP